MRVSGTALFFAKAKRDARGFAKAKRDAWGFAQLSFSLFFGVIIPFHDQEKNDQKQSGDKDNGLVFIEIEKEYIPELVKVITEREKNGIPYRDADERKNGIGRIGLPAGSGDECDISTADRNDSPEADGGFSVVAECAVRSEDRFFCGRETHHELFHHR